MDTQSVGRNQWRSEGRLLIPTNGLIFYAPLWDAGLSGDPFNALNIANGGVHSCDVNAATWGGQGRTFDGTDDYIDGGSPIVPANDFTMVLWAKKASLSTAYYVASQWKAGTDNRMTLIFIGDNTFGYTQTLGGTVATNAVDTNFHHFAIARDAGAIIITVDGNIEGTGTIATTVEQGANFLIGTYNIAVGSNDFAGTVGEFLIYNRALLVGEIQQHYLATKWRYQ